MVTDLDITSAFTQGASANGFWRLQVSDLESQDVGRINSFSVKITSSSWPPRSGALRNSAPIRGRFNVSLPYNATVILDW